MQKPLEIKNLSVTYRVEDGTAYAVNDLDLVVHDKETLGFVGETGAGKTTTAMAIMRLIPNPPGKITGGEIFFNGQDLPNKTHREMRAILGPALTMIFPAPITSLNPPLRIC